MVELTSGITVDPAVRFGKPVIQGTRVPVDVILARIASGMTFQDVATEYGITEKDIYNVLQYAAQRLAEEQVWVTA